MMQEREINGEVISNMFKDVALGVQNVSYDGNSQLFAQLQVFSMSTMQWYKCKLHCAETN